MLGKKIQHQQEIKMEENLEEEELYSMKDDTKSFFQERRLVMPGRRITLGFVIVGLLGVVLVGQSLAQQQRARPEGRRGFQERMVERMKETLEASDEEWKILQPRVEKVLTLSREARGMGGMAGMAGFGRRGRPQAGESAREQTQVEKCQEEVRTVLENKEAKPEEIKQKLTALRKAKEKAKQDLAKAQQELREVLTLRQEARLVLMGLLN